MSVTPQPADRETTAGLRYVGAMLSDVGRVRQLNEDSVAFVVPPEGAASDERNGLILVADGMGGHSAGEVASAIAAGPSVRNCSAPSRRIDVRLTKSSTPRPDE